MRVGVLGGKGFVGSAFVRYARKHSLDVVAITRDNYSSCVGEQFELLINANGNSKKYLASEDPTGEFDASVATVQRSLLDFRCFTYVYCSSVDVYNNVSDVTQNSETNVIDVLGLSRYGCHKFIAEEIVMNYAPHWLIFRFGGFVGPGLKKNSIYDMVHGIPLRVHIDSAYQYLSTDFAAEAVMKIVMAGLKKEIFNLCGRGVITLRQVASYLPDYRVRYIERGPPREHYEISIEKIEKLLSVMSTVESVREFLGSMKESLSQIA
jgi:nucleoside-diphosphate-sugar epimerase